MNKIKVIVVCGATATGKTKLATELAKKFNGEIVSADSMQIYKEMDIVSAKPTPEEMQGIPHHLIDFLPPAEKFSVADYVKLAKEKIAEIVSRGKYPIVTGGTGLYVNSLIDGTDYDDSVADEKFRNQMYSLAKTEGNAYLHELLKQTDPEMADKLHKNDISRIIRALEINKIYGKKMSVLQVEQRKSAKDTNYEPIMLAIDLPREKLYSRINRRTDDMVRRGLVEEARQFFVKYGGSTGRITAYQAIGYKELKPYFDGTANVEYCIERVKQATRNYAKRQLIWFRKDKRIKQIQDDIFNTAESYLLDKLK
jgi:tRNA dimethylallyltransferase